MMRFGLIGLGNIGKVHVGNFAAGKVRGGILTAVCSNQPPSTELPSGACFFNDVDAMLDSGDVDAVIVATPHMSHRPIGEKVLRRGLHLMMEKPLTATKLDGERLLEIPLQDGQQFGIMLNLRVHPQLQRIRGLLEGGQLGELQRAQWKYFVRYRNFKAVVPADGSRMALYNMAYRNQVNEQDDVADDYPEIVTIIEDWLAIERPDTKYLSMAN